ncbi:MAG: hypothetical protein QM770_13200 [Tepidisphaeraceae bacterium]
MPFTSVFRSAVLVTLGTLGLSQAANAAIFTDDFDADHTSSWTVNNNNNGTNSAAFFYDYNVMGIPSAPHSSGGSTRGLKIQANTSGTGPASGALPGISVSPTGMNFYGDITLRFDWWHNWIGGTTGGIGNTSGGSGSTQLSTFGVLTSGTSANYAGAADGVFFAADGDGASAQDYRTYSSEKQSGYAVGDAHNTYAAGSQNNTNSLYTTLFPAGATVPTAQNTAYPGTQFGTSVAGTAGFRWHDVIIQKVGSTVTWTIDGTLIATVDTSAFTVGTKGYNILFGMADTSYGAGTPAATFQAVDFTLIDNVTVLPEPAAVGLLGALGTLALRRRK